MLSNYPIILQLPPQPSHAELESAWQISRERFMRLTRRGPLRLYRNDLLKQADKAYEQLKHKPSGMDCQAAAKGENITRVYSSKSYPELPANTTSAGILRHHPLKIGGRQLSAVRDSKEKQRRLQAKIEDDFCLEVLFRLEGDLLRYSNRRDLLKLAMEAGIADFRANLLIAQIVESVRRHKLYEPSEQETALQNGRQAAIHTYKSPWRRQWLLAGAAMCLIIDVIIVAVLLF